MRAATVPRARAPGAAAAAARPPRGGARARTRRRCAAAVADSPPIADEKAYEACDIAFVTASNDEDADYTVLDVTVKDYPGLVRVSAWVLNGLGLRVERAFLETIDADDGTGVKLARNRYFLTDARGQQVEDLHLLELNMQEHCTNCAPSVADLHMDTWRQNNVGICNEEHPEFTLVKIQDENRKPELLLESAATLTAMGYCIHSATYDVSNEEDAPACDIDDLACRGESSVKSSRQTPSGMGAGNVSNARTLVFRITGSYGKLSYQQASGLLYVFGIQLDKQLLLSPL